MNCDSIVGFEGATIWVPPFGKISIVSLIEVGE